MGSEEAPGHAASVRALDKAPTFIKGLDEILEGGLPRARTTMVSGPSGSGKTLLALEFLYRGALAGEPGIFIGFEEPVAQVRQNVATLGWNIPALEANGRLFLLDGRVRPDTLISGDFSLKGLLASAAGKAQEVGARRIVIDALEVVLRLFPTPQQGRAEMHLLNDWLHDAGMASILTVRSPSRGGASVYEDFFDSMSDCIINMDARVVDQISTRRLRIVKYRGSGFGRNEYPYVITANGIRTAPISTVGLRHKPLGEKVTTGIDRLDEVLEGGYRRASCILIAGMPGTGKTIMTSTFVDKACARGERVLYISFEESSDALVENVSSAGLDLRPHLESGGLHTLASFPEAMGAEEHYIRALSKIEDERPDHVVVDAISACERMGGRQAAFEYLMRILNACKEMGITILLVNQTSGRNENAEFSGNSISSMVDTVIILRYHEAFGEITRLARVLKSRGSGHSNRIFEYSITDEGITFSDVYIGEGGVMTGTARRVQQAKDRAEAQRLEYEIESKTLDLKRLQLLYRRAMAALENPSGVTDRDLTPAPAGGGAEEVVGGDDDTRR